MALITLASAAGSPGVSTTALGLALVWPRPVILVEADPAGSSALAAGYFHGQLDHAGLVELAAAHRSGLLGDVLPRMLMPIEGSAASLLLGSRSHEHAVGLAQLWEPLLAALTAVSDSGQDVLVDAGRLGLTGAPLPFVERADATMLVTRSSLPALVAAQSWATTIAEGQLPDHAVGTIVVGPGWPYPNSQVAKALGLPVAGVIEWDPARAAVFSEGAERPIPRFGGPKAAQRSFDHSGYVASLRSAADTIRKLAEHDTDAPIRRGGLLATRLQGANQ